MFIGVALEKTTDCTSVYAPCPERQRLYHLTYSLDRCLLTDGARSIRLRISYDRETHRPCIQISYSRGWTTDHATEKTIVTGLIDGQPIDLQQSEWDWTNNQSLSTIDASFSRADLPGFFVKDKSHPCQGECMIWTSASQGGGISPANGRAQSQT